MSQDTTAPRDLDALQAEFFANTIRDTSTNCLIWTGQRQKSVPMLGNLRARRLAIELTTEAVVPAGAWPSS